MNNKRILVVGHIGVQSETKKSLKDLSIPTFKIKSSPMIEEIKVQSVRQSRRERRNNNVNLKSRS